MNSYFPTFFAECHGTVIQLHSREEADRAQYNGYDVWQAGWELQDFFFHPEHYVVQYPGPRGLQ